MTAPAIIRLSDARRLANLAKDTGCRVIARPDGSIEFIPAIPAVEQHEAVDRDREIVL